MQLTLEEDVNLPETKPDVSTICFEKGQVVTEEVRTMADAVAVKGKLVFCILYHTQENGGRLERMEGKIPFEEKLRVEGLAAMSDVTVTGTVDDLTVTMINSRKLSIQSVITLEATADVMKEEELPTGASDEELQGAGAQILTTPVDFTQVCTCKKDVFRIKEDLVLPSGYPNVGRILWKDVSLGEMNFRLGEEKIYAQGEVRVFVLYEGEGEEATEIFETETTASTEIECSGCREDMALDVRYGIAQWELTPKPDVDGELRELGLEMTMDLKVCAYADEHLDVVKDVYGVKKELRVEERTAGLRQLLRTVTGKTKVADQLPLQEGVSKPQSVHALGEVSLSQVQGGEGTLMLRGSLNVKVLYVTGEEENPYGCLRTVLPFEYVLEIPGMQPEDTPKQIQSKVERLSVAMQGGEGVDVKAILSFSVSVFRSMEVQVADAIGEEPLDQGKRAALPSMVVYVVREGDDLWSIGKRYYVPTERLTSLNGIAEADVTPGQKLLIIKEN